MNLPYFTFSALEDGTIYAVMRTNTKDLESSGDSLRVTLHAEESPEALTANTNKQAYRLERDSDSDGAVQLVPKEPSTEEEASQPEEETNETPMLVEGEPKEDE